MDLLEKVKKYLSNTSVEEIKKDLDSVSGIGVTGPSLIEFSQQLESQIEISSYTCDPLKSFNSEFSVVFENAGSMHYDQAA